MEDESLISHLEALRKTLISCILSLALGVIPMFFCAPYVIDWLIKIMLSSHEVTLNYFSPMEVFILQIKTAVFLDFLICFPFICYKIWQFVLPALYDNERRFIKSIVISSGSLFILGALFCLFFILPMIIDFGLSFTSAHIQATLGISNIISLSLWLSTVFGLMFQFPLIVYALVSHGIISGEQIKQKRPYVLVAILIIAALLTPPDVVSQLMLATPTYLLFEGGLYIACKKHQKKS